MFDESLQLTAPDTPHLLARLVDAAAAASDSDLAKVQSTLEKALLLLSASPGLRPDGPARLVRGGLAPWQAKRVAAYIREHIGMSLRAGDLAALVKLSKSHFHRAFKVSFQETLAVYIRRQRMCLAQEMMLTTRHPIARVALECGLYDQAHFSRVFRRVVGQSPLLWRRRFEQA